MKKQHKGFSLGLEEVAGDTPTPAGAKTANACPPEKYSWPRLLSLRSSPLVARASWTLLNQCIVSGGNFALNIILARHLSATDYGKFALFLGAIFILRTIDYSFISYPLSVRLCGSPTSKHANLLGNTVALAIAAGLGLAALLSLTVALLGGVDIMLPVVVCYLAWQSQETLRRCLLANFRYRAAMLGDAVSFVGQAISIAFAARFGTLSIAPVLYIMSIALVLGALAHATKLRFAWPDLTQARLLAREYVSLGKWSMINYMIVLLRIQLFPWGLAVAIGTVATASFQAALNIANLMNPITLGIGNVIPQAAAQAYHSGGFKAASQVARGYTAFGLPPVLLICLGALLAPEFLLRIAYGAQSPYLGDALAVQLVCVAGAAEYVAEMFNKTFLGVKSGKLALLSNGASIATAVLALPLIHIFGTLGACVGLTLANCVRLLSAWIAMKWLIAKEKSQEDIGVNQLLKVQVK